VSRSFTSSHLRQTSVLRCLKRKFVRVTEVKDGREKERRRYDINTLSTDGIEIEPYQFQDPKV
jgi:hypothetical protein